MSWPAWRPFRKEAAARRHNQAWTKAKATKAQDSARQVSVAQSMKVRGGHEQCPGLVQEAGVDVWMCGWWGHQPEGEKSSSPGLGSGERRLKRSSQSPPSPSPQAAKGGALQGGPANLGPAHGLHRGSGLKIIFSDNLKWLGGCLGHSGASISICGANDGMKRPPDSGTKGPWGPYK